MQKKNSRAVIFDLDGVLIDSLPFHYESYKELYSHYGINYSFKEFVSRDITAGAMNAIPRVLKEHGREKEIQKIVEKRREDFRKMLLEKNMLMKKKPIKLHKGVLSLLKSLKRRGYKLAVASGGTKFFINHVLRRNKILGFFDVIVTGESTKKKPHPDIFLKAA